MSIACQEVGLKQARYHADSVQLIYDRTLNLWRVRNAKTAGLLLLLAVTAALSVLQVSSLFLVPRDVLHTTLDLFPSQGVVQAHSATVAFSRAR